MCAPLRFEARAVRRGLRDARAAGSGRRAARRGAPEVLAGRQAGRAARAAELATGTFATMADVAGGVAPERQPGDLVVATEVVTVRDGQPDPATALPRRRRCCWASCGGRA